MLQKKRVAVMLAAVMLAAVMSGCTSERTGNDSVADTASSAAEAETSDTTKTVETTEPVTEATTTAATSETLATETTAASDDVVVEVSNITLTHITEGGEGLGVFNEFSGNIRGEVMQQGSVYKNWTLDTVSGHAETDDTVDQVTAVFRYSDGKGFSVNGTVEVMPADDPDYPNMMYFHSDDVDAFPKYMNDNRGEAHKAKFIIENSSDVYMLLDKDNPPAETAFSISVTVDTVTVRYAADGSAYDTIHVTAASNR